MEKISRIIPPSARTKAYDISRAQPGRPGAPQLGRPEFEPAFDRVLLSENLTQSLQDRVIDNPVKTETLKAYSKPTENVKSEMIRKMTDQFFMKKSDPKEVTQDGNQSISEEIVDRVNRSSDSKVMPESSSELS
ncbi:MAG: hypothetical protein ACK5V3_17330 [Bdellovibrionales bacterium]